jgi:hypothetical protein
MRKVGTAAAAIAVAAVACTIAGSGVAAAASGSFHGFGSDSNRSTAEQYAVNNAYGSAAAGGFASSECSVSSVNTQPYGNDYWQSDVWINCYRPDTV